MLLAHKENNCEEVDISTFSKWSPADKNNSVQSLKNSANEKGKPWVLSNMVVSMAGGYKLPGGSLTSETDQKLLDAIRRRADVLMVGRKTIEADGYSQERLSALGEDAPRLAFVTSSLQNCSRMKFPSTKVGGTEIPPCIITCRRGHDKINSPNIFDLSTPSKASILYAGSGHTVDLGLALSEMGGMGVNTLLCEGGPTLYMNMLSLGLIDEINLTVSPVMSTPEGYQPHSEYRNEINGCEYRLEKLASEDSFLYLKYLKMGG